MLDTKTTATNRRAFMAYSYLFRDGRSRLDDFMRLDGAAADMFSELRVGKARNGADRPRVKSDGLSPPASTPRLFSELPGPASGPRQSTIASRHLRGEGRCSSPVDEPDVLC